MNIIKEIEKGNVELWLHEDQKTGYIEGNRLYKYLQENKMLESCLSLEDLEEIQKQGLKFFRKHFSHKYIFAWKSVRRRYGYPLVPCLFGDGDGVVLDWYWLGDNWLGSHPAARLASSSQTSEPKSSFEPLDFELRLAVLEAQMSKLKAALK